MDLGTVKNRMMQRRSTPREYRSILDFRDDVRLVRSYSDCRQSGSPAAASRRRLEAEGVMGRA